MRPTLALLLALSAAIAAPAAAGAMSVPLDHAVRLRVPGAAASVVVGNPAVADVTVVDSHTVYVQGKGYGSTDVVVLDAAGRALFNGDVTVTVPSSDVSVYRGSARTDFACAPGCAEAVKASGGSTPAKPS